MNEKDRTWLDLKIVDLVFYCITEAIMLWGVIGFSSIGTMPGNALACSFVAIFFMIFPQITRTYREMKKEHEKYYGN